MVFENIFEHAARTPDKIALYCDGRGVPYAEFARWIERARRVLARHDLPVGKLAVLDAETQLDGWVLGFALRSLGLDTAIVPSLAAVDKVGLLHIDCAISTRLEPGAPNPAAKLERFLVLPSQFFVSQASARAPQLPAMTGPFGGHVLVTSGTTGIRKKVLVEAARLAAICKRRADVFGVTGNSIVNVFNFSPWVGAGYKTPSCTWAMGGAVILNASPPLHRSLIIDGITHAHCTPGMLAELLRAPAHELRKSETMRLFVGGGPLPYALAEAARARLTPHVFSYIGTTEAGTWAVTSIERPEDTRLHRIHPSATVQVVDEDDRVLPAGQMGMIRIRAGDGATGYLGDEQAWRAVFRGGYFYSGDLGTLTGDGRLILNGRVADVVNILGYKIGVLAIEQLLQERLATDGVCVLAHGEGADAELLIIVQSRRPIAESEMDLVLHPELPRVVRRRVVTVNVLPRNEMGKVDRAALKRQILAH